MRKLAVLGALALTACHDYFPTSQVPNATGESVRAVLTSEGTVRMAPLVGPHVEAISGRVASADDSAVVLKVNGIWVRGGQMNQWTGEAVPVPRSAVESWQREKIAPTRTALFAGGLAAAVVILNSAFRGGGAIGTTTNSGGPAQ